MRPIVHLKDSHGTFNVYRSDEIVDSPQLSVVMSVFNGEKYLRDSIESILEQTFRDFEFIILDDGSTDNTHKIIKRYAQKDKRIALIEQQNIGLTKSLNRGIKISRGKCIARQDADDISLPERFKKQLYYINKGYDFVCCRTRINNSKTTPLTFTVFYRVLVKSINVFVHGTYLFRKEILNRTGLYNEIFVCAQDYEFIRRLIRKRVKIYYMRDILYHSTKDDNSITKARQSLQKQTSEIIRKYF